MSILNTLISVWYIGMAFVMASAILAYASTYAKRYNVVFPWLLVVSFLVGACAFFLGCALHHNLMAMEMESGAFHNQHRTADYVSAWFQVLGAPVALFAAVGILRRFTVRFHLSGEDS